MQNEQEKFVTEKEVSNITAIAIQTLRNHRSKGIGIPYCKLNNKSIRYSLKDVFVWMNARKIETRDYDE